MVSFKGIIKDDEIFRNWKFREVIVIFSIYRICGEIVLLKTSGSWGRGR